MKAYIVDEAGRVSLKTPYDADFVAALKAEIPFWSRSWNPETRTWQVQAPFIEAAVRIVSEFFDQIERRSAVATPSTGHGSVRECIENIREQRPYHAALFVLPGAPESVINAAYRALAKQCHPDLGGEHDSMIRINQAYENLANGRG